MKGLNHEVEDDNSRDHIQCSVSTSTFGGEKNFVQARWLRVKTNKNQQGATDSRGTVEVNEQN